MRAGARVVVALRLGCHDVARRNVDPLDSLLLPKLANATRVQGGSLQAKYVPASSTLAASRIFHTKGSHNRYNI